MENVPGEIENPTLAEQALNLYEILLILLAVISLPLGSTPLYALVGTMLMIYVVAIIAYESQNESVGATPDKS